MSAAVTVIVCRGKTKCMPARTAKGMAVILH